jgi:oligoribonuclease NrnB/cAMP/cGMP phosphodiesterase (DHH superfamily)
MKFEKILVIYHDKCPDGMGAAWAAYRCFLEASERGEAEVVFYAATHGNDPPMKKVRWADRTYILDFSYDREIMVDMSKETKLLVLDHHKKAEAQCHGLEFCEFDMDRSGAGMAWDYFFPREERPWLIDYIETRDIWTWKWPNAAEALAYLDTLPRNFQTYDKIYAGEVTLGECVEKGTPVRSYVETFIDESIDAALRHICFQAPDGRIFSDIPIINGSAKNISDLINRFAVGHAFGLGYFRRKDGKYQYSVRVSADSDFDGNKLANLYGGGGHVKAAGFQLPNELEELSWAPYTCPNCGRKVFGNK